MSQTVLTLITAILSNNPLQIPSLGWLVGSQVLILASAVSRRQAREVVDFPNSSSSPADPLQRHAAAAAAAANLKHQLLHDFWTCCCCWSGGHQEPNRCRMEQLLAQEEGSLTYKCFVPLRLYCPSGTIFSRQMYVCGARSDYY